LKPATLSLRPAPEVRRISGFIREVVREARSEGVVVGVSGGVDSAVAGALCVRALGKERVVAALLPSSHTPRPDVEDSWALVRGWGVRWVRVGISPIVDRIVGSAKLDGDRVAVANVQARVRMTVLYYVANTSKLLVAGTGDRSEVELGYFSKFGDGGVDFLPIAHLYKTQVRALGAHLGIPGRIVEKPASPQLWAGQSAAQELPADYDRLDRVLGCLYDDGLSPGRAAAKAGVSLDVVNEVRSLHERTAHKRRMPPSLREGWGGRRLTSPKD
jgi:NAD+ synthase